MLLVNNLFYRRPNRLIDPVDGESVTVLLKASQPPQTQIQHLLEEVVRFSM